MCIWTLKSWHEAGKPAPKVGQFPAITLFADPSGKTGGQTNWVQLTKREIDWIKSLADNRSEWHWADHKAGTIYLGEDWKTDTIVHWPRIALASSDVGPRNQIAVISYTANYVQVAAIPKKSNYSAFNSPWLLHQSFLVGTDGMTRGNSMFLMPLFNPASGFKVSKGATGLWMSRTFLKDCIGDVTEQVSSLGIKPHRSRKRDK